MRNFLVRVLYAVICVAIFWWIFPLFVAVVGFPMAGSLLELVRALIACIAVIYVLFGPAPPVPWA